MKQWLYCLWLTALLACNAQPTQPADATKTALPSLTCSQLNGKEYTITIFTGGKIDGTEVLRFAEKTVENSECLKYGFGASEYSCSPATDGSLQFATTMTSEAEGRMDWTGKITASGISGSFVWIKAGQADIHYTFEGK